jgi:hypothetical protein
VKKISTQVTIEKNTLHFVVTCFHVSQSKATLLETQTRLLHDALERKNLQQHYELVLVQNKHHFEEDDDAYSDQHPAQQQISKTTPYSSIDVVQLSLSKRIIKFEKKSDRIITESVSYIKRRLTFII